MVLQAVDELCPVNQLGAVRVRERRVELGLRHVTLVTFDVLLVVPAQAIPRGGVEEEGNALEDDGQAHVQVPVSHVVVKQASAPLAALEAPEKACRIDPSTEDQWRGDESCRTGRRLRSLKSVPVPCGSHFVDTDFDSGLCYQFEQGGFWRCFVSKCSF